MVGIRVMCLCCYCGANKLCRDTSDQDGATRLLYHMQRFALDRLLHRDISRANRSTPIQELAGFFMGIVARRCICFAIEIAKQD